MTKKPVPNATSHWYYLSPDNQSVGPIPENDLRAAIEHGILTWDTYVWDGTPLESGGAWIKARDSALAVMPAQQPEPIATPTSAPATPEPARKSWCKPAMLIASGVGVVMLLLLIIFIVSSSPQKPVAKQPSSKPTQVSQSQPPAKLTISDVADKILPSTVRVNVINSCGQGKFGSGFFVTKQGDILTNEHVINDASKIEIVTNSKKIYTARIRAYDKERDMALLAADVPQDEIVPLAISNSVPRPGMEVVVAGSPRGLEQTISNGIVSAVRDFPDISLIQITAPISPGSSGGPVVNMSGEIVGMSTGLLQDGQNLNFAVSSKHLAPFVPYAAQQPAQKLAAKRSGTSPATSQAREEAYDNVEDRVEVYPYKRLARVTATNLNCREYPTTYSDVLDVIPEGAEVYALGTYTNENGNVWYYIEHDYGMYSNAWVYGRYLDFIDPSDRSAEAEGNDNMIFVEKDTRYTIYLAKSPVIFDPAKSSASVWTVWVPTQAQKESVAKTFNLRKRPLGDFALKYIIDLETGEGAHVATVNFYDDGSIARSYVQPSLKWEGSSQNSRIRGITRVLRSYAKTIHIGEIVADRATCRTGPSINAKAIGWPEMGTQVTIYEEQPSMVDNRTWYRVSYEGSQKIQSGWISSNLIEVIE